MLTDERCPRCSAGRDAGQEYCLECGLHLPSVTGSLASWRRRWLRRVGWYPGDWVWAVVLAALVATVGATAAIEVTKHRAVAPAGPTTVVTPPPRVLAATPSAPTATNGHLRWPPDLDGWTIVLVSWPVDRGRDGADAVATRAARNGLPQVGVLTSADYASLQPGSYVVFSGVYTAEADAATALRTVQARGFATAYLREIAA